MATKDEQFWTSKRQEIYNHYLLSHRKANNKPGRARKNFSDFGDDVTRKCVQRLESFFDRHFDVVMSTYFEAPYKLYSDVKHFDLEFFSSRRGIKAYTTYKQLLLSQTFDGLVDKIKPSFEFIAKFCLDNKVRLSRYPYLFNSQNHPHWLVHVKNSKVCLPVMFCFPGLRGSFEHLLEEDVNFYVPDLFQNYIDYKSNYLSSKLFSQQCATVYEVIQKFLEHAVDNS